MFFQEATRTATSILSRSAKCIGWYCLTAAEQFGIIFSSVVVFLVLSLVYMYCLGRACVASKDKYADRPGTERIRYSVNHRAPPNIRVPLPTAQNRLTFSPVALGQQPTNFTSPLGRPYIHPACYYGVPLVPPTYPAYSNQSPANYQPPVVAEPEASPMHQGYEQAKDPFGADRVRAKSPGWRRRINQILRIPVGRASTIHTNSAPGSPTSAQYEGAVSRGDGDLADCDEKLKTPKKASLRGKEAPRDLESRKTDTPSIRSTAATVYSDDFEMISPTSSIDIEHGIS